jgi:O-antigen/teichoic acid export membrane protein
VLLLAPAGLIVAVLLALVPIVYGRSFDQSVVLGFVLLPGVLALGAGKVLASVVAGRGAPRYNLYTGVIVAAITLVLYFTLIPAYGEWGAAAASSISYFATAVISAGFFRRVLGISLSVALIPTAADLRNYPEAFDALRAHLRSRRARRQAA